MLKPLPCSHSDTRIGSHNTLKKRLNGMNTKASTTYGNDTCDNLLQDVSPAGFFPSPASSLPFLLFKPLLPFCSRPCPKTSTSSADLSLSLSYLAFFFYSSVRVFFSKPTILLLHVPSAAREQPT